MRHNKRWDEDETLELMDLGSRGYSWERIGDLLGRSADACSTRFYTVRKIWEEMDSPVESKIEYLRRIG